MDGDADDEHRRDGDEQADEQVDVQVHAEHVAEVGGEYHQDALGDVDDVEDTEDQRQADRHQRVNPAGEYAIDDGLVDLPSHVSSVLCVPATADLLVVRAPAYPGSQGDLKVWTGDEPAEPTGRTWTKLPFCHWKTNVGAAMFLPTLSNCAGPCTVCRMMPLCR